jgi:hypothetical protein
VLRPPPVYRQDDLDQLLEDAKADMEVGTMQRNGQINMRTYKLQAVHHEDGFGAPATITVSFNVAQISVVAGSDFLTWPNKAICKLAVQNHAGLRYVLESLGLASDFTGVISAVPELLQVVVKAGQVEDLYM